MMSCAAAGPFAGVHRLVGSFDGVVIACRHGEAAAGLDAFWSEAVGKWFADACQDSVSHSFGCGRVDAGEQHGELVASDAGDQIVGSTHQPESAADLDEDCVTGCVSERVVDLFEVIDVDVEHRRCRVAAVDQRFAERHAIGEPGQRVLLGGTAQFVVGTLSLEGHLEGGDRLGHDHLEVALKRVLVDTERHDAELRVAVEAPDSDARDDEPGGACGACDCCREGLHENGDVRQR